MRCGAIWLEWPADEKICLPKKSWFQNSLNFIYPCELQIISKTREQETNKKKIVQPLLHACTIFGIILHYYFISDHRHINLYFTEWPSLVTLVIIKCHIVVPTEMFIFWKYDHLDYSLVNFTCCKCNCIKVIAQKLKQIYSYILKSNYNSPTFDWYTWEGHIPIS